MVRVGCLDISLLFPVLYAPGKHVHGACEGQRGIVLISADSRCVASFTKGADHQGVSLQGLGCPKACSITGIRCLDIGFLLELSLRGCRQQW
jgi:hypothetical protein